MPTNYFSILVDIGILILLGGAIFLALNPGFIGEQLSPDADVVVLQTQEHLSPQETENATSSPPIIKKEEPKQTTPPPVVAQSISPEAAIATSTNSAGNEISRIKTPYPFAPSPAETLNASSRAALVNILCEASGGSLRPTSGSGIIIDPRGIIITNAHVAQYFLLEDNSEVQASCLVRNGSPARPFAKARLLYIPPQWVKKHAHEVLESHPVGTGEDDYALLFITEKVGSTQLPQPLPYVPFDVREAIGFAGDPVVGAAYPAEFVGGAAARNDLNIMTVATQIKQLLTFTENWIDVISLGGNALAQSGSSGGAIINEWGHLIGLIVTTSEGDSTDIRDLRAITMAHIDRSIASHTGEGLQAFLTHDPDTTSKKFGTEDGDALSKILLDIIKKQP